MELKEPQSMDELIYMTIRDDGKFKARAWVFKELCPKCKKGIVAKPKNPKTGRPKIRATEYACSECDYRVPKEEYEETLMCNIEYTCPACNNEGKIQVPFKRKTFMGTKAIMFFCEKCNEKLAITKKMKAPKKSKKKK